MNISASDFWRDDASDELKNSFVDIDGIPGLKKYNVTCSNSDYKEGTFGYIGPENYIFFAADNYDVSISVINENDEQIDNNNYESYADLTFTISMPE